ncbi:uncharacterized protein NPIL_130761 [Nephila pilipes]|uniref:Cuticular protein n=1 Tax=Nephila pilipes TaxID=299642 RepID=A0A8X6N182_NEPPI|nr:uncharacterized protein NPIL_130761 [Nephila pilipes]
MFRIVTILSIITAVFCQHPRYRAPPQEQEGPPPQAYREDLDYRPQPPPVVSRNPPVVHRPASVHYVNIGEELAGDYKFGYDTGKGDEGQSFREETRLPDGTVRGAYGYIDEAGRQRIVKYTAGKDGFKVEGDGASEAVSRAAASRPAPQPQPAYREPEPAYQPPPPAQPAYRPQPAPAPQPAYRAPPAPQPAYRPQPQPAPAPQPAYRAPPPAPQPAYRPQPQPEYRAPPQPAYRAPPAPRPQRPAPRRQYAPRPREEEPDYDYPDNEVTERRLAPIDTALFNYNIGNGKSEFLSK